MNLSAANFGESNPKKLSAFVRVGLRLIEVIRLHFRLRMKDQDVLKVIAQVNPFVGAQDAHGQAEKCPDVNDLVAAAVVFAKLVNLGVAVVAAGNAVRRAGGLDLVILQLTEFQAIVLKA